jgi:hypothetical protein
MTQLTDVYSYIKLIDPSTGTVIADGSKLEERKNPFVVIRYVVVNDSNTPTNDFYLTCALRKDGEKVELKAEPQNPVGLLLKLQPKQALTFEHTVSTAGVNGAEFAASMLADVMNLNKEESEQNNKATAMFEISDYPR